MVRGRSAMAFRVGMPMDAAGPVAESVTPTLISAPRAGAASAARKQDAMAQATRFIRRLLPPAPPARDGAPPWPGVIPTGRVMHGPIRRAGLAAVALALACAGPRAGAPPAPPPAP